MSEPEGGRDRERIWEGERDGGRRKGREKNEESWSLSGVGTCMYLTKFILNFVNNDSSVLHSKRALILNLSHFQTAKINDLIVCLLHTCVNYILWLEATLLTVHCGNCRKCEPVEGTRR